MAIGRPILAGLSGVNLFAFSHPGWFAPATGVVLALGLFVSARLAAPMRRRQAVPEPQG